MLFYYPEILNNKDIISAYKAAAMLCVISNKKVPLETVVFFFSLNYLSFLTLNIFFLLHLQYCKFFIF